MSSYDPDYDEFAELPAQENKGHESIYSNDGAEVNTNSADPHDDIYFTDVGDLQNKRESDRRDSERVPPPLPRPAPRKISVSHTQTSLSRGIVLSTQNESLPTPPVTPKSPSYAGECAENSFTKYGGSSRIDRKSTPAPNRSVTNKQNKLSYASLKCSNLDAWIKNNTSKVVAILVFLIILCAGVTILIVYFLGKFNISYI